MTTLYCTLAEAKSELKATTNTDDAALLSLIRLASARLDALKHSRYPYFAPYARTELIAVSGHNISGRGDLLKLPHPLLTLDSLTWNGTTMTLGTDAAMYPSSDFPPVRNLWLQESYKTWLTWGAYSASYRVPTVRVTGMWGLHRDWANAFIAVDALAANVSDSATTITVADVDGANTFGETPRISAGHLLKIENEYLEVTATNTSTNVLTVRRGVNGTTAVAHSSAASVSVYRADDVIRRATMRQATLLYSRRGVYEQATVGDFTTITYPQDLLTELLGILQSYVYD